MRLEEGEGVEEEELKSKFKVKSESKKRKVKINKAQNQSQIQGPYSGCRLSKQGTDGVRKRKGGEKWKTGGSCEVQYKYSGEKWRQLANNAHWRKALQRQVLWSKAPCRKVQWRKAPELWQIMVSCCSQEAADLMMSPIQPSGGQRWGDIQTWKFKGCIFQPGESESLLVITSNIDIYKCQCKQVFSQGKVLLKVTAK